MFHVKHYYDDSNAEFYILRIILMCFIVQLQYNVSLKTLIYTVFCYNNRDILRCFFAGNVTEKHKNIANK